MSDQQIEDWIEICYGPELSKSCGMQLSELFAQHLSQLQLDEKPFQEWVTPQENVERSSELLEEGGSFPQGNSVPDLANRYLERFRKLVAISLEKGQGLHHPRCAGHQVPAVPPLAAWFDAMTSLTNQVQGVYEMGPWSVAVERTVLQAVGEKLGFQAGKFGSLVTSGGSLANLTALLAARQVRFPNVWKAGYHSFSKPPVLVVQQDVHYCINRSVGVIGLGTNQIVSVPLDTDRRMKVSSLDAILADLKEKGVPVLAVVSVAGSTACGAFDPLPEIAKVCRAYGVWLHVDAAHGGGLRFSKRHRGKLQGLELADSVVVDAHKMLFVPAVCAMLFFKDPAHQFVAFDQEAPYLFDPSEPSLAAYDNAVVTMECTKRASAMGLWGVWSIFGEKFFEAIIDHVIAVTSELHQLLQGEADFEVWEPPVCNILLFRYRGSRVDANALEFGDQEQLAIRRQLLETGSGYLTQTNVDGRVYLRVTLMNPMVKTHDLKRLISEIRIAGQRLEMNAIEDW